MGPFKRIRMESINNSMKKRVKNSIISIIFLALISAGLSGCETPTKPDFGITHTLEIPLYRKTVDFLGGPNALVDTTKGDLKNFISTQNDGLVELSTRTSYTNSATINTQSLPKLGGATTTSFKIVVNLNPDDPANGKDTLDLYDNKEAKIIAIKKLDYFSKRMGSFSLLHAKMQLYYRTNLPVGNQVYAGIVGGDANGNSVYFKPKSGSQYQVSGSPVSGLQAHGQELPDSKLMTFQIGADSSKTDTLYGSLHFNESNSNIGDFISNLPTSVRFIGKAIIIFNSLPSTQPSSYYFDTAIGLNVPLDVATPSQPATYIDTLSANLSKLPSGNGKTQLSAATLQIHYTNDLPLSANLQLRFLDQYGHPVTSTVPDTTAGENPIILKPAAVNSQTHFVSTPNEDVLHVALNKTQLDALHNARLVELKVKMNTTGNSQVRIQAKDYIGFDISGNFKVTSKVNPGN